MIRAEGVCKSFDKKEVLTDIDAVFEPGKVNLIIGKSGSGKTVLLKSLIGLHSIDKGKIFYNDREGCVYKTEIFKTYVAPNREKQLKKEYEQRRQMELERKSVKKK